ncbi:MAG: hypothetical protein IPO66_18150 [Rhodanobacteraceae bacterium]|nr:hypothetical protein [Rhodanobacteraceae bacterium]
MTSEGAKAYYTKGNQALRDKLAANPELYGRGAAGRVQHERAELWRRQLR